MPEEKKVVFQTSDFESFAKLAQSIIQEAVSAQPAEVVAVRSHLGGAQLKLKTLSSAGHSAALAKYVKLQHG